ncbi:MAG TPA: pitrilysin family protein [Planctomycetota bacterium]|nr:pitrilysin family protein [Planctomycetota bacterium]
MRTASLGSTTRTLSRAAIAAFIAAICVAALAQAETFYERKPADIFLGEKAPVSVTVVTERASGTVQAGLSNGMVVLLKENHASPLAIARITVKTGSIYEQEYLGTGISHLFEHLIHGANTSTRSEAESHKILESIGNLTNASTTYDQTSYYIKVAKGDLGTAISLLADWMKNAKITDEEFNREMKVVQRESERSESNPNTILGRMMSETMFHVHPVRYPVIGFDHVRAKLRLDDIQSYRARMYAPNNMVFTVVGDFDWHDALEQVRAAVDGFTRGAVPAIALPTEPEQVSARVASRAIPNLNTSLLAMSYRTVSLTHPDLYPLDVLAGVLGQGESSRLVRVVRNDRRLVQSIVAWSWTPGFDAGQFAINASIPDPANVPKVRDAVKEQLDLLKRKLVKKAELERVKNSVAAGHVYQNELIEAQAGSLASGYVSAGDPDFDERYVAGIAAVTSEEIRRVANTYFPDDHLCDTLVEPESTDRGGPGEGVSGGAGKRASGAGTGNKEQGTRNKDEAAEPQAPGPKPQAQHDPVRKDVLPNGLRVLTRRNPSVPMVTFELYFLGGLRVETEQTSGTSNFTAQLWGKSTKHRSPTRLADELEGMGASLSTGSANNTIFLRGTCLAKDFDRMLEIASDVVLHPAFDKDECEKLRTIILSRIKERDDSVHSQAQRLLQRTFYPPDNPFSMDMIGRAETVSSFTLEQLEQFYATCATGPNGVLAVWGDIDSASAQARLAKAFARLNAKPAPKMEPQPAPVLTEDKTAAAYRERKDAAAVFFAWPDATLANLDDRYPMVVMEVILGGGSYPGGWLHAALRGAGLVYEVHAFNVFGLDPRHFQIQAITNPAAVDQVKAVILEKVEKMKKGEFTPEEFALAKKIALTEHLTSQQTNSQQAQAAAIDELYGFGYDFSNRFPERIDAVTLDDVVRVANKYLTRYACAIVTHKDAQQKGQAASAGEKKE